MNYPHLCGGVFFFLMAQATYKNGSSKDHANGKKDEHSNTKVTVDLLRALSDGQYYPEASKDISNYRNCKSEGSLNVPFNNVSFVESYDDTVKNKYSDTLERMSEFTKKHIDTSKAVWLVKALLDVIENDNGISESDTFFINRDGSPVSKSEIRTMTTFYLQPFLIGISHYILVHRSNKNSMGIHTLEKWSTQTPRKPRIYTGNAGEAIKRNIEVNIWEQISVISPTLSLVTEDTEATPREIIDDQILKIGQIMADAFRGYERSLANETLANQAKNNQSVSDDIVANVDNSSSYSSDDIALLKDFTNDYDEIMLSMISENYGKSLLDMSLPTRIQDLYKSKWHEKADTFSDPNLKSYVFGLLGELNSVCNSFTSDSVSSPFIKNTKKKIRNLFLKLHPGDNAVAFPYDAFIDDWDDGEF